MATFKILYIDLPTIPIFLPQAFAARDNEIILAIFDANTAHTYYVWAKDAKGNVGSLSTTSYKFDLLFKSSSYFSLAFSMDIGL